MESSVIACGSEKGHLYLFKNEYSSQISVNRTMPRSVVNSSRARGPVHRGSVSSLRFLEEHVLVSASLDKYIRIWDCTEQSSVSEVLALESRDSITALEVASALGERAVVVAGTSAGSIQVRDLRSNRGEGDKSVTAHKASVTAIAFDSGYSVVTGDTKGCIEVRDLRSLRHLPLITLNGSKDEFESKVIHATSKFPKPADRKSKIEITEDIWAVAMGKKRKAGDASEVKTENIREDMLKKPAHSARVISVAYRGPHRYTSVSQDKTIKSFCALSGQLLRSDSVREKPLAACFSSDSLILTSRTGLDVFRERASFLQPIADHTNPHVGSVTAVCPTGSWGFCSGGTDKHVFVHSISSS